MAAGTLQATWIWMLVETDENRNKRNNLTVVPHEEKDCLLDAGNGRWAHKIRTAALA
jgi:hypothetical protein